MKKMNELSRSRSWETAAFPRWQSQVAGSPCFWCADSLAGHCPKSPDIIFLHLLRRFLAYPWATPGSVGTLKSFIHSCGWGVRPLCPPFASVCVYEMSEQSWEAMKHNKKLHKEGKCVFSTTTKRGKHKKGKNPTFNGEHSVLSKSC